MKVICSNFLLIVSLLTFVTVAPSKSIRRESREEVDHKCDSDLDCPRGHFCYKVSYLCASCLKCEKYNRLKSNTIQCSTKARQCGDCIAGYYAPKDTDGFPAEVCIPDDTNMIERADESVTIKYVLLGVLGLIVFMGFIWLVHRYKCQLKGVYGDRSETTRFCAPSAPPPPYPDSPFPSLNNDISIVSSASGLNSATMKTNTPCSSEVEINSIHGHHVECEFEKKVQAVPFYNHMSPNSSEDETEYPEENVILVNPNIHDDTTQPSTWRPSEDCRTENGQTRKLNLTRESDPLSTDIEQNGEEQTENESLANTSNEEVRHFSVISGEADCSPVSTQATSSRLENTITSDENGNEQRPKKRRTQPPETNSVAIFNNFNLCIVNTNGHTNENVMFFDRPTNSTE